MENSLRFHGDLRSVADSEWRGLRPIGAPVRDVATWTGGLLGALAGPAVHVFQGVPTGRDGPTIPHAVVAGHHVVLIESVTWPSGRYAIEGADQVHCDDVYIGQSVAPLIDAVRRWRARLPAGHRVTALVVVHPTGDGPVVLPPARPELAWTLPHSTVRDLCDILPGGRRKPSPAALVALVAASEIYCQIDNKTVR